MAGQDLSVFLHRVEEEGRGREGRGWNILIREEGEGGGTGCCDGTEGWVNPRNEEATETHENIAWVTVDVGVTKTSS